MGFLAPLYIAGLLAIGLPILFHLIRRNPHGKQVFSSLMFLTNSPPRLTRRSRLTNILLLILRALAFLLLAFAFARPYLHQGADKDKTPTTGRRIALLVDTSASMRRGDLWKQANAQVDQVLHDLSPLDEVALYFFDRNLRPAVTFTEWNEADPSARVTLLRTRMAAAEPTWSATKMGDALAALADQLAETDSKATAPDHKLRQIVLISDLQQGSHAEALQGHEWPQSVVLEVRPLTIPPASNATVQWVQQTAEEGGKPDTRLRVRVSNEVQSKLEQFSLAWANDKGPIPGIEPIKVYVAPGHSQIVRVARPEVASSAATQPTSTTAPATAPAIVPLSEPADRLVLTGDECDFDNTLFIVPPRMESVRLVFLGDDAPDNVNGLLYYLHSALGDTTLRKVEIISHRGNELIPPADLMGARLVVVAGALSNGVADQLRQFVENKEAPAGTVGADILWVVKDVPSATGLDKLLGVETLDVHEATGEFALINHVDMAHPLFVPFADAQFSDFTKIHFWKHRVIQLPNQTDFHILASLDSGDPWLFERPIGKGTVRVMTSGWQPADSQLALSTKFVPLMEGLIRRKDEVKMESQYAVDEPIALPPPPAATSQPATRTMLTPDGQTIDIPATASTFEAADHPGIYTLTINGQKALLAVNLAPDESRTAPMLADDLSQWGAKLGGRPATTEEATHERQLRIGELENRQKLWRWLIVVVLGLLAVETFLAGRLARRASNVQATV